MVVMEDSLQRESQDLETGKAIKVCKLLMFCAVFLIFLMLWSSQELLFRPSQLRGAGEISYNCFGAFMPLCYLSTSNSKI